MLREASITGVGLAVTEGSDGAPVVLVEARGERVPIFVSPGQAQSIELARNDVPPERPLTHDLLLEMVTDFGGGIEGIRIDDLTDGTFYAKIDAEEVADGDRHKAVFDARPSDAIALAIRENCPIRIADSVIDAAAIESERPGELDTDDFRIDEDRDLT